MIYLTNKILIDFSNYSKNRCQNILFNLNRNDIYYARGQYKGYIYISKIIHFIIQNRIKIKHKELYNFIKIQKNNLLGKYHKEKMYIQGILDSLYDCLNYLSK